MKANKIILAAGLGLAFSASAQASTVQYIMTQSNILNDNVAYLSVTINDVADSGDGGISFTVSTLSDLDSLSSAGNYGIKKFAFNSDFLSPGSVEFTGPASGRWIEREPRNISKHGEFQTILSSGRGNKPLDELTFVIHQSGDSIADYTIGNALGNMFAAHVIGTNSGSSEYGKRHGAWFYSTAEGFAPSAVPVPAAAWLFGSGLLGLAGVARRREIA